MSFSTLRSLSLWTDVAIAGFVLAAVATGLARAPGLLSRPSVTWSLAWAFATFAAVQALLAVFRQRAFMRRHPFVLKGYWETLHHPAHVLQNPMDTPGTQRVSLVLQFQGAQPSPERIDRLIRSISRPSGTRLDKSISGSDIQLEASGGTHVDGHRRWFTKIMKRLSPELIALHHEFPLVRVEVRGD